MLAFEINKKEGHVKFPAYSQPKLDGLRLVAILKGGRCKLYSRTQKEFTTLPHIAAEIERLFKGQDLILDGEAYNHKFKNNFNKIIELIKRDDIHPDHTLVEYHIYDVVAPGNYDTRTSRVFGQLLKTKHLQKVETVQVSSREELEAYQIKCVEAGYEGCIYRNPSSSYEHKRSSSLLKVKSFQDKEFLIVGVEEGKGKLMGCVGAFLCELNNGTKRQFKASPAVTLKEKAEMWKHHKDYIGKMATVQFQNYTPDGSLRFPIFKCIREE